MGGIEKFGGAAATGGWGQTGIKPVIQGGGTYSPTVRVGVMGDVRRDDEVGGWHPYGFPPSDNEEAGKAEGRQGMG